MNGPASGSPEEEIFRRWIGAVGDVTMPLLAGFSVTSVIVVISAAVNFRWPGAVILTLTIASIMFISAIECVGNARLYFSFQAENKDIAISKSYQGLKWAMRARVFYLSGILALFAGLGLALAPIHSTGVEDGLRWAASIAAFAACLGHIVVMSTHLRAPPG